MISEIFSGSVRLADKADTQRWAEPGNGRAAFLGEINFSDQ